MCLAVQTGMRRALKHRVMQSLISVDPSTVTNKVCKANCPAGQVCYLHLHGASSWVRGSSERPSVYAAPSAPGLVMASGAPLPARAHSSAALALLLLETARKLGTRMHARNRRQFLPAGSAAFRWQLGVCTYPPTHSTPIHKVLRVQATWARRSRA